MEERRLPPCSDGYLSYRGGYLIDSLIYLVLRESVGGVALPMDKEWPSFQSHLSAAASLREAAWSEEEALLKLFPPE